MTPVDDLLRNLHVLIVDDETFVRGMVKQMLRSLGITNIREANEGATALKELQLFPPDLVICDLSMEPIDGIVFVQMLRNHHDTELRTIPVLILSGKNDLASVKEAASKGINGYLVKPVSLQSLRSRLETIVSGGDFVSFSQQRLATTRRRVKEDGVTVNSTGLPMPEVMDFTQS
jgi:two-component system chemotaxis response regulator CheY